MEKRKTLNQIFVKQEIVERIVQDANQKGEDIRFFAGDVLEYVYTLQENFWGIVDDNPKTKALAIRNAMQREERARIAVYQIAAMYSQDPTESNADRLKDACDAAGVAYDEVLQTVGTDPFSSIIAKANSRSKLDQCILWLTSLFKERKSISSQELYAEGIKKGYNEKMLQRARTQICYDNESPSLISQRIGATWIWQRVSDMDEITEDYYTPIREQRPIPVAYFLDTSSSPVEVINGED